MWAESLFSLLNICQIVKNAFSEPRNRHFHIFFTPNNSLKIPTFHLLPQMNKEALNPDIEEAGTD